MRERNGRGTGRRRFALGAGTFALLLVALVPLHEELLTRYARLFVVDDATRGADFILILSGHPETRARKAIELYRQGFAPQVLVTAVRAPERPRHPQYDRLNAIAARERVAIFTIPDPDQGAESTYDEALQAADYIRRARAEHVIVVTDAFHTARARYAFRKVFRRKNIHVRLEFSAAEGTHHASNWWRSARGVRDYLTETIKLIYYLAK